MGNFPPFMPSQGQHMFGGNPEDFIMRYGHQLSNQPNGTPLEHFPNPVYQPMYDSGVENHIPDHVLDDPEMSEPGGKKKRGASATLANDNELRKLLRQYEGYTLKQMAAEVMKHEGAGGKAEKVKQVFAMIW